MDYGVWEWVVLIGVCVATCSATIAWYFSSSRDGSLPTRPKPSTTECAFLFNGTALSSFSDGAHTHLSEQPGDTDWERLFHALVERFPNFPADPNTVLTSGVTILTATDGATPSHIEIERLEDTVRVAFADERIAIPETGGTTESGGRFAQELSALRATTNQAPHPIWHSDEDGRLIWHNRAYSDLSVDALGQKPNALKPLFDELAFELSSTQRAKLTSEKYDKGRWFDVTKRSHEGGHIFFATDVTSLVSAETAQRNFVQTLAKTFAQISIGLAIFDRNMQLALFNPALTDLTALPPEFLSARPNLLSFFDRLRDARVMPEPKDYASWRDHMTAMVAQANDGQYCETWALPSGSTYRVTGRPHPDGAVAFLFEDISAEVSLTRRFRADLEQSQNVLDHLDDAVAVFTSSGTLSVTNKQYCELWQTDPDSSFAETGIIDAMRDWQRLGGSQTLWGELRDFVLGHENRVTWSAPVILTDGRAFDCNVHPMQHGASLIRFVQRGPELELLAHSAQTAAE